MMEKYQAILDVRQMAVDVNNLGSQIELQVMLKEEIFGIVKEGIIVP